MNILGSGSSVQNVLDQPVVPEGISVGKVIIFGGALWVLGSLLKRGGWRSNPRRRRHSYRRRRR